MGKIAAPYYVTPDGKFKFFRNLNDGPTAYDVFVNGEKHGFYIADRTLPDLTSPNVPTERAMLSLESMCGSRVINQIMNEEKLTAQDIHMALLQLRIYVQQTDYTLGR